MKENEHFSSYEYNNRSFNKKHWSQEDINILRNDHIKGVSVLDTAKNMGLSVDDIYHMIYSEYNAMLKSYVISEET